MSKGIHDKPLNYELTHGHEMQFRVHTEGSVDAEGYIAKGRGLMIDLVNEVEYNSIPHFDRSYELLDGAIIRCRVSYGVQQIDIYPPGVIPEEKFFALYAFKPKGGYPQAIIAETAVTEENPSGLYLYFNEDIQAGPANSQDNTLYTEDRTNSEQHNDNANRDILFSLSVKKTSQVFNEGILFHKQYTQYPGRFNPYHCYKDCFFGANCERVYAGGHLLFNLEKDLGYENSATTTRPSIIGAGEVKGFFVLLYMSGGELKILTHRALSLSYSGSFNDDPDEPLVHFNECEEIYSDYITNSSEPVSMCTFTSAGEEAFFYRFYEVTNSYSSDYKKVKMKKISMSFKLDGSFERLDVTVTENETEIEHTNDYVETLADTWRNSDWSENTRIVGGNGGYYSDGASYSSPTTFGCPYWGDYGASGVCGHSLLINEGACDYSVRPFNIAYKYQLWHCSVYVRRNISSFGGTPASESSSQHQDPMMFLVGVAGSSNKEEIADVELSYNAIDKSSISSGTSTSMNVTSYVYPNLWGNSCAETHAALMNEREMLKGQNSTTAKVEYNMDSETLYSFPWGALNGSASLDTSESTTTYSASPGTLYYVEPTVYPCLSRVLTSPLNIPRKPAEETIEKDYESERYVIAEGSARYGVACAIKITMKAHGDSGQINKGFILSTEENTEHKIEIPDVSADIGGVGGGSSVPEQSPLTVTFPYKRLVDFSPHPKGYALLSMSNESIVEEREDNKYNSIIIVHNIRTGEDTDIVEKYNELLAETIATESFPPVEPFAAGIKEGTGVSTMLESFGVLSRVPKPRILPKVEV